MKYIALICAIILFSCSLSLATIPRDDLIEVAQALAEREKREYQKNPFKVIREGLLKIKTKAGTYETFTLNPIQKKLLDQLEADWFASRPIRYRILKARQEGVSTLTEAILYVLAAFRPNNNALILADDIKGSNYLFDMSKLYHQSLQETSPWLVPKLKKDTEKALKFADNLSQIIIETGDNKEAGRKYTFRIVHISESAFIPNIGTIKTGLNQAVPDLAETIIIEETTANGAGGDFYDGWNAPQDEYSLWRNIFFAFFDNPEYSKPFESEEQKQRLLRTLGKDFRFNEFDGEENELIDKFKCSLEQLNWRRWAIKNKCDGDLDKFHQEYPAYPEQAFLVSGRPRFNVKILQKMRVVAKPPILVGYLSKTGDEVEIEENNRGYLKIWEKPKEGFRYVIGGDVAEGKIQVESKKEPDFSTLHVLNRHTLEQVAVWHGRIDPDLLGLEAIKLALYYNHAFIGIENNNSGLTTVTRIKRENYWNVYFKTSYDQLSDKESLQLGWKTTTATKPLMIDELAKAIREMYIKINDEQTIRECMTYVIDDQGRTNAQTGCFDDCVIGLAIAYQMTKHSADIIPQELPPEKVPDTFAWHYEKLKKAARPKALI